MDDELAILARRLRAAGAERPVREARLEGILERCARRLREAADDRRAPIHRDYYPDQLLVVGGRAYLLDLDLCSLGHPAIDIGNFAAHLIEHGLRFHGDPSRFDEACGVLADVYQSMTGASLADAIDACTTTALARHIAISRTFPDRRSTMTALIELCEERLR